MFYFMFIYFKDCDICLHSHFFKINNKGNVLGLRNLVQECIKFSEMLYRCLIFLSMFNSNNKNYVYYEITLILDEEIRHLC